ncbi:hypothetical protein ABW20_dc0102279 [Dactylellina cionopaga]|nr:hypothetical protein ABW20_dc0102279 [Dactylellina cionopaga]
MLKNPEYQALAQIREFKNDNIVTFYCAYEDSEYIYFIFNFAQLTLQDILDEGNEVPQDLRLPKLSKGGALQLDTGCRLWKGIEGITKGLRAIHYENPKRFGRHKDLKPTNILVDSEGTFFISDFGLSSFTTVVSVPNQRTRGKDLEDIVSGTYTPPPVGHSAGPPEAGELIEPGLQKHRNLEGPKQ